MIKCLEKNRTRRYQTANELAHDIECHLSHQPVSAAAPTLGYRAMKYVRRHRRVLATAAGFALLLLLGTTLSVWQARRAGQAEKEWALETALPEIGQRLEKDDYAAAFKLVERARPFIGNNPQFQELAARAVSVVSFETTPPGANVFIREYSELNPKWEPIGKSPFKGVRGPQGVKRWKVTLPGYEMAEGALVAGSKEEIKVQLDKVGALSPGMVRIQGETSRPGLFLLDSESLPELKLSDFLLDRYEVTNRRFKEFVEAGGYQKPDYWKHKFLQTNGVELSWSEAMKRFADPTGQPGPPPGEMGTFRKARGTTRSEESVGTRRLPTRNGPASVCPQCTIGAWPPEIRCLWMPVSSSP